MDSGQGVGDTRMRFTFKLSAIVGIAFVYIGFAYLFGWWHPQYDQSMIPFLWLYCGLLLLIQAFRQ